MSTVRVSREMSSKPVSPSVGMAKRMTDGAPDDLELGALLPAQIAAVAVVADRLPVCLLLQPQRIEPLLRAVAAISVTVLYQPLGPFVIERQPLGLEVGSVRAADFRAFVPWQLEPVHAVHDVLQRVGHEARAGPCPRYAG